MEFEDVILRNCNTSILEYLLLFFTSDDARAHVKGVTIEAWLDR
jgi:hypothetical protein